MPTWYTKTQADTLLSGKATPAQITAGIAALKAELLAGAPGALDTLNELAAALGNDANYAATITAALNARPTATQVAASYPTLVSLARYPITKYGATQAKFVASASMTAGSAVLHSSSYSFQTSDIGKRVGVRGAGPVSGNYFTLANDGVLIATISSVTGGDAVLDTPAVTTCSGVPCVFGLPIDTAMNAAVADAAAAGGGTVQIPPGVWLGGASVAIPTHVSVTGAGRSNSIVYVAKTGTAASTSTTPWLYTAGTKTNGRYDQVDLSDFTLDGQFFVASDGYGPYMKMISVSYTSSSNVERMAILNNPATALGYDASIDCVIASNIIRNPSRLNVPQYVHGGPGGAGIGLAIGDGLTELSMAIRNNFIYGGWSTAGGAGHHGILIEAATVTPPINPYLGGVVVTDNFVEGLYNGILDCAGLGTIIKGNTIRKCNNGINLQTDGVTTGFVPRDTLVANNVIQDGISAGGFTGSGIMVSTTSATNDSDGRALIEGNIVTGGAGHGIWLNGTAYPLRHVNVRGNAVRDNGYNGIYVRGTHQDLAITGNSLSGNGRANVAGQKNPIALATDVATSWTDGRLQSNDYSDYAGTPTQTSSHYVTGSTLTNVSVSGNTGDVVTSGDAYARKTSTTTITNTTTLATVSALAPALAAGASYELTAVIEYTSIAAAGIKLGWVLPAGASLNWDIIGPGSPTVMQSQVSAATLSGVDGATSIVAFVKGFITMGATAGTLGLQAAQATANAGNTVVTTKTAVTLRKVA